MLYWWPHPKGFAMHEDFEPVDPAARQTSSCLISSLCQQYGGIKRAGWEGNYELDGQLYQVLLGGFQRSIIQIKYAHRNLGHLVVTSESANAVVVAHWHPRDAQCLAEVALPRQKLHDRNGKPFIGRHKDFTHGWTVTRRQHHLELAWDWRNGTRLGAE